MAHGKCPSCDRVVTNLVIDPQVDGRMHPGRHFTCINFLCPHCDAVMGTQLDPAAFEQQRVSDLLQEFKADEQRAESERRAFML